MTSEPKPLRAAPLTKPDDHLKVSVANAIRWQMERTGVALTHLADIAAVDRVGLHQFLAGKRRLYSDAIDRLLGALHLSIAFDQHWKPPAHLLPGKPGPAPEPQPRAKRRSRPNNKPR